MPKLLDIKQLAERLDVSESTINRWRKWRLIPAPVRLGPRMIRWHAETIEHWLAGLKAAGIDVFELKDNEPEEQSVI